MGREIEERDQWRTLWAEAKTLLDQDKEAEVPDS